MLGSIFIGLSGMNAFSEGLKQISNNITNINSTGFKSSSLQFEDFFGAGDQADLGAGQGVSLAPPRLNFKQGELRQTDRDLDLAVDGTGFLVLLKEAQPYYARTGSFEINEDGDIALAGSNEYKLAILDASGQPAPVSVNPFRTNPPQQTTRAFFAGNLSSTTNVAANVANIKVFAASGQSDNWNARFERSTTIAGNWTVIVTNGGGTEIGRQTLKFISGVVDPTTSTLTFEDTAANRSAIFDFSAGVDSFSSGDVSSIRTSKVDGYGVGEISTVTLTEEGLLEIGYSNEQKKSLGPVAIAEFRDPQTLTQRGAGLFVHEGANGLDYVTTAHKTAGRVVSNRIEASNVNLSAEFGDLILVQRGFQASSQVVSVSNDMIQQLFGMRGQG
ncbi:MAG: flagellar hook-basal body complex protein [Caulobacterales bacterium]